MSYHFKHKLSFKKLGDFLKKNTDNNKELFHHDTLVIRDYYGEYDNRVVTDEVIIRRC